MVMSEPSAIAASIVQLLTGWPSTLTTQTPQFDVSHPQWVPVRPSFSRMKWTSSMRASHSSVRASPLTVTLTLTMLW